MKRLFLVLVVLLALGGPAFAEDGYVRLTIQGTNVNLRPEPRPAGQTVARMSTGDVFFAEKWPITCDSDGSPWYKIVLPAADSGAIEPLGDWDQRFTANVAFVNANFAAISPLEKGDLERILATPVGRGYAFNVDPGSGEFDSLVEAGFIPFSPACTVNRATDIHGGNPFYGDTTVVGRHKRGTEVRVVGMESEGAYYAVADPSLRQPVGFVEAADLSIKRNEPEYGENNFNWPGFKAGCVLSVGANLPEIIRKWGEAKIERAALEFLDEYVIHTTVERPDFQATFYEDPPKPGEAPGYFPAAIRYLQTFSAERKGALICGINIGGHDKKAIIKLLGEPDAKDQDETGEVWNWHDEFDDLYVHFDGRGHVSSVSAQARAAD